MSKWSVSYYNEWDNSVELFQGTKSECERWYENNIEECESLDAFCTPDSDKVYELNHRGVYYDAPMYYE